MTFKGLFQLKLFYDSMKLIFAFILNGMCIAYYFRSPSPTGLEAYILKQIFNISTCREYC